MSLKFSSHNCLAYEKLRLEKILSDVLSIKLTSCGCILMAAGIG